MTEHIPDPKFEEEIRDAFGVPDVRVEFVSQLKEKLTRQAREKSFNRRRTFHLQPVWAVTAIMLAILLFTTLIVGPKNVVAAVRQFLGYIPGVGIIEQGESLRILAEPVSVTRDGITVMVDQAVLTENGTDLQYSITGVSLSAYPHEEFNPGCIKPASIHLPDGTELASGAGGGTNFQLAFEYPAIPQNVNQATFILPCILNTLPGGAPENWEIPLHFIPAPADFRVLPVVEVVTQTPMDSEKPTRTNESNLHAVVSVDQVIETEDGYILLGAVRPQLAAGQMLQNTGIANVKDADGNIVVYDFPMDVQQQDDPEIYSMGGFTWAIQFKGEGVKFPLSITFSGVVILQVDPQATASLSVDVGDDPQTGQIFELNQAVTIAGNTIYLVSVTAESDGYTFRIDPGMTLSGVSVAIEGYSPSGGGGGGSGSTWGGTFTKSMMFIEKPVGKLTLVFSDPLKAGPTEIWQTTWKPGTVREFSSDNTGTVCLDGNTIGQVPSLPDDLDGKVIFTVVNPEMQIVMANLDGSEQKILAENAVRGALSSDGTHLVYSDENGLAIVNIDSGEKLFLSGQYGRDLHWSPDGSRIALMKVSGEFGIFVIGSDGKDPKQLTNLGTESIAGWSPDGSQIYYAIPAGVDGFQLRRVAVDSLISEDLSVLKGSSLKAPMPALSPDGKRIAYRARDNSSVYLRNMDGSQERLLLSDPGDAVNGIAWDRGGHLLGVSVMTTEYPEGEMLLIAVDNCETYRLPGLRGELDGVLIH
jgi:WD40 repeat protein